jgi:chemotaxis methyl-accepting protein methylase
MWVLDRGASLRHGGVLVIGHKEELPGARSDLMPLDARLRIFQRGAVALPRGSREVS